MKKFVYQVAGWEFVDTVAFGEAWREAKFKASQLHEPIYRLVINGEDVYIMHELISDIDSLLHVYGQ